MTTDTQKSLLDHIWSLLTKDAPLKTKMGDTVRCYLTWAEVDAEFPYLVHRIDFRREPGTYAVKRATYYLDIWSNSPNADEILLIRERLIQLLDELIFSTDDVSRVHIEIATEGFIPEAEQGIFHYAMMFDIIFRRDSEAISIAGR